MNPKITNKKGFTLIELLVVVAIIGILASVVLASLNTARSKARDARRWSDLKQISTALEMYYHENGSYPSGTTILSINTTTWPALATTLSPYISSLPTDPRNNDVSCFANGAHFYTYTQMSSGQGYGLYASLENPKAGASDPASYPCCATPNPDNCMYKATNGGVGIVK